MEDRLDKLEKLILAKNKETKERFDRFLTHNTEAIRQLQEDNSDMKSELQILAKNKETMDRLDKFLIRNNETIHQLQEDNHMMKNELQEHVSNNDEELENVRTWEAFIQEQFVELKERVNHLESQQVNRRYWTPQGRPARPAAGGAGPGVVPAEYSCLCI